MYELLLFVFGCVTFYLSVDTFTLLITYVYCVQCCATVLSSAYLLHNIGAELSYRIILTHPMNWSTPYRTMRIWLQDMRFRRCLPLQNNYIFRWVRPESFDSFQTTLYRAYSLLFSDLREEDEEKTVVKITVRQKISIQYIH